MRSKILFATLPFLLVLASCGPASTPAPVAPTQNSVPPAEDCFLNIDFVPGETGMNEVISAWGNPSATAAFGKDTEYWSFGDVVGYPYISFKKQAIETVRFFLKNCSLEKIVNKLGPPEKVEITMSVSDLGDLSTFTQNFHYASLGFSFFRFCDETQDCYTFRNNDFVDGKEFYTSNKIIEDSTGFNRAGYAYNWHGFGVDVEKIENKMKGFTMRTPTP